MSRDDPFGLETDAGRTRIRPARAAPTPPQTAAMRQQQHPTTDATARMRQSRATDNPLLSAFGLLLGLAPELDRAQQVENAETLRVNLLDNLIYARDGAVSQGVPLGRADQAAWFVGALLDDIALNTPWGGSSGWPAQPLVSSLYGDVDAGEQFFTRSEELLRYPDRDRDMLELAFHCLSFGFRGKHRAAGPAGEGALGQLRAQMARHLRDPEAEDAVLSPHWEGVTAAPEKQRFIVPLWAIVLIAGVVMLASYVGLSMRLSDQSERLYTAANTLPPLEPASISRPGRDSTVAPEIELTTFSLEMLPLFAAAATPETLPALTGREDVSLTVLAIQATDPEVFRSAKADINTEYTGLINAIAAVLVENSDFIGAITIVGHTDNVPVQTSNPFGTNQKLSEARAQAIADMLIAAGVSADVVTATGKAAAEPIGDNGTRAGRAQNRRVEIIIAKRV